MRRWAIFAATVTMAAGLVGSALGQETSTYLYDAQGRLTSAIRAPSNSGSFTRYGLDGAGNRTLRQVGLTAVRATQDQLLPGEILLPGQQMVSTDNRFRLVFQLDGNVVLYFGGAALWATATMTGASMYLDMQGDGNLVLYDPALTPLWYAVTSTPGARLVLQNDGNLVIYSGATALWATGTGGH